MQTRTAFALAAILTAAPSGTIHADDWPNWRGPNYDGVSEETGWDPEKLENRKWQAEVGTGFASVSVSGGRVYTIGHDGAKGKRGKETIYCLDAKTGKEIWTRSYSAQLLPNLHEGGPSSTPTVHGDKLYTLSKDGRLRCSDAASGDQKWERHLLAESAMGEPAEWGFASSPLIVGGDVIVEAAQTLAFDKNTGKVKWKSERYEPAYGTPTAFRLKQKTYLATLKNDGLVILGAGDGKTLAFEEWKTRFSTNANTPIVRGDQIFISTGYGRGCALFRFTGDALEQIYTNKDMSNHMSNCVLVGDHLYGFDGNTHTGRTRQLRCLEFATGKVRWTQTGLGIGALRAAGDRLIILSEKGEGRDRRGHAREIRAAGPRAGQQRPPLERSPRSAGGFLYVRNAAGRLVAIDLGR